MVDEEWFAALYRSCYRRLVLAGYALTADLGAAQEITREAFTIAHGRLARVEAEASAESWLRAVVVGLAGRRARRLARPHRMSRRSPEPAREPAVEPADGRVDPHRAVLALALEQRIVAMLHHVAEVGVVEIASILDIREEAVTARLFEARTALAAGFGTAPTDSAIVVRKLGALRDELHGAVPLPDVATVFAGSRAKVFRRRRTLAALLAVVIAAAAIRLLRTALPPVPGAEPDTAPLPSSIAEPARSFVYDVDVLVGERLQGYALRAVCPTRSQTGPCPTEVLYTEDGQFWAIQSRLPAPANGARGLDRRIRTLGPFKVVIEARTERWYSNDSALTWRRVPVEPGATVAAIPPDAVLEPRCFVVTTVCRGLGQLLVTLPDSGRSATLANPPALDQPVPGPIPAADGGWWVSGKDPGTGRWSLAVSHDAGRTWSITPLPPFTGTPQAGISVTAAPKVWYATAVGQLPDTAAGLLAIFRSTDAGATWTAVWQAGDGRVPRSIAGTLVAAPDGSITLTTQDGGTYVSTDQAATFRRDSGPARYARRSQVGYIASFGGTSGEYSWSRDGSRWFDFTVG
ncbi:MAG: hypothetical protein ACJ72N_03840 [Labedaea sp.]